MFTKKKYYLSSLDSITLEEVRKCDFERLIHFKSGKEAVIARIDSGIQMQDSNGWSIIDRIILSSRYEDERIYPPKIFPCFVYVSRLIDGDLSTVDEITSDQLSIIGIGELYKSENKARDHIFD